MPQWLRDARDEYIILVARGLAVLTLVAFGFLAAALWGPSVWEHYSLP